MSGRIAAKQCGKKVVYTRHSVFPVNPKISKGIGKKLNGIVNMHYADDIIAVAEAAKENLTDSGIGRFQSKSYTKRSGAAKQNSQRCI